MSGQFLRGDFERGFVEEVGFGLIVRAQQRSDFAAQFTVGDLRNKGVAFTRGQGEGFVEQTVYL